MASIQTRQSSWSSYSSDEENTSTRIASALADSTSFKSPMDLRWQSRRETESAPFEIQNDNADGEKLAAQYQMLEELGSGSFGIVYKAIEKDTGEIVAIKHVDLESSEEDLSDILSELAVLSSCSSSHVTKYKRAFLRRQTLWIVMEYLGGGSCADLLKPPPHSLSESHIAIICRELLIGLSYLHGEGKLHRDIKAANVLLGMDGRVKLADFGVAAQLIGLKSMRNTFVGTPFWMSPEVIQQEGHDAKADVWSLGITAMELANGQPPHANVHPMKVLFLIPKQPSPKLEGGTWSREFRDFVSLCLTKDADYRPTAKQLLKHKFVKGAGKIEGLQEVIQRKQEWEASKGAERNLKYYAETLRQIKTGNQDDDNDEWVFDTVKAVPAMDLRGQQTQKRRKVARKSDLDLCDDATQMMEDLSLDKGTAKRISGRQEVQPLPQHPEPNSSVRRSGTKKRVPSSAQPKQPLGVNMSFGNSPSTVRQFKRVSQPKKKEENNAENEDPLQSNLNLCSSPLKANLIHDTFIIPQPDPRPLLALDRESPQSSPSRRSSKSRTSSQASTLAAENDNDNVLSHGSRSSSGAAESKEAQLGRKLYARAVGIACQEVLNETGDQQKREAVSRLAEAWSDLEMTDPEGLFHIMKGILGKMKDAQEKVLGDMISMMPPPAPPKLSVIPPRKVSSTENTSEVEVTGTVMRTPSKQKSVPIKASAEIPASRDASPSPAKLILAQNNPHLKSHRRRQSHQSAKPSSAVNSRETSQVWSPTSFGTPSRNSSGQSQKSIEEKELDNLIKGASGGLLEHTRAMADVMFERWCDGLRMKWPAV